MTNEEAFVIMKLISYDTEYGGDSDTEEKELELIAIDFAINALEKQIQKKPYDTQHQGLYTAEFDNACPVCLGWFTSRWRFCPNCGQAIDWSDKE